MNTRHKFLPTLLLVLVASLAWAAARFPSTDPNPRVGTPDDPRFDCNEPDDEDGAAVACDALFDEQVNLLGFAPDATKSTAVYKDAARFGQGQVSGVSADRAWKISIGLPQVTIAIMDTGIRWDSTSLRRKIHLNRFELPRPQDASGTTLNNAADTVFGGYDVNADGTFNVEDYATDPRVDKAAGPHGVADAIDAQDLIVEFSDGSDADANGYIDDIAGWDFFEDDNDPGDQTSYASAGDHGTGRAKDAAEETNEGQGEAGVCPRCTIMPMRVWDTFVTPGDTWAAATVYAADNGAQVTEAAIGMLQNTRASKAANTYAFNKGVALMQVSSDLNTANHNYPTNYVESVYINGCVADVQGGSNEITGNVPGFDGSFQFPDPILTWFRNSNLTQYGAHAHVCYHADTGSFATGQASGGAGLIHSRGIELGLPLSSNEVKQILTMSAEDVTAENTQGTGTADPALPGWDEHFGYGRANLGAALARVAPTKIPPEALIQDPAWWKLLDPGAAATGVKVPVRGLARAARSGACTYRLEYAVGIEPAETAFTSFANGTCPGTSDAALGELPMDAVAALVDGSRDGSFPAGPARANPNQHAFTVRLVVEDGQTPKNRGEDRKVYFAIHDPTWHTGWPKFTDTGGETSPVLYDIDGDGTLEFVDAASSGELCVYRHDGEPLQSFNNGACWQLSPTFFLHADAPGFKSGAVPPVTGGLRTPSIADLDGDFEPDIVLAASDGRIFVLRSDGSTRLTLGVDPTKSERDDRNDVDHPKRGVLGSPVLADLDGDGTREIIQAALDGFIYVWDGKTGAAKPGFPREVRESPAPADLRARGELISTVAIADLFGDGKRQIITGSADVIPHEAAPPSTPPPIAGGSSALVAYFLANTIGGDTKVYAIDSAGAFVPDWPVAMTGLSPDVLPFVGPQHAVAVGDLDRDGSDEVVASMTTGDVHIFKGDGSGTTLTSDGVVNGGVSSESSRILNLFEYAVIGNLNGAGGLDIAKVGITVTGAVNLLVVGQNFPFNHVVQAWDSAAPENYLPGYPTAHDDFGLLSTPAIASVTGSGKHLIAGSGLYLVHAYDGLTGTEAAGFPKQTGGWQFAVPAIGDVDGDGKLNLAISTREGYRFVWDLAGAATPANNSEWWMEGHDECHTNNYGTDCRPPNRVKTLLRLGNAIQFTAPGDDWGVGSVNHYELRTAATPIANAAAWNAATPLPDVTTSTAAGANTTIPVDPAVALRYVAVLPVDEAGNRAKFVSVDFNPPPPVVAGVASVSALTRVSGTAGQTLDAGGFRLTNTGNQPQLVSALTLRAGTPAVFSELRLVRAGGSDVVLTPVGASNAFSFDPPIELAAGASIDIAVRAVLAAATAQKVAQAEFGWLNAAQAAGGPRVRSGEAGLGLALAGLLGMGVLRRRRWIAGLALASGLLLAGCGDNGGGAPRGGTNPPPTGLMSTLDLTAVAAASGATPVTYSGLPAAVAEVTRAP